MTFRFPKRHRLRKRTEFLAVQRAGRRFHGECFVVVVLRRDEQDAHEQTVGRVGITVSKKVGIAVVRNRIKRLVREFVRHHHSWVPRNCDLVVIAKRSAADTTSSVVAADLNRIGRRLARC